jgi:hypothetical protein
MATLFFEGFSQSFWGGAQQQMKLHVRGDPKASNLQIQITTGSRLVDGGAGALVDPCDAGSSVSSTLIELFSNAQNGENSGNEWQKVGLGRDESGSRGPRISKQRWRSPKTPSEALIEPLTNPRPRLRFRPGTNCYSRRLPRPFGMNPARRAGKPLYVGSAAKHRVERPPASHSKQS